MRRLECVVFGSDVVYSCDFDLYELSRIGKDSSLDASKGLSVSGVNVIAFAIRDLSTPCEMRTPAMVRDANHDSRVVLVDVY
jgi:hypothetical protein